MNRMHHVGLVLALAAYLAVGVWDLSRPGLGYDEAYEAAAAVQWLNGLPIQAAGVLRWRGLEWPIMSTHIDGPLPIYLSAGAFRMFGTSVPVLRAAYLAVGALTLLLLWRLARTWCDQATALIAVWLCATCPPFVWWTRAGGHWNAMLTTWSMVMLLAGTKAWRTGQARWVAVATSAWSLGVVTKVLFVWWLAPLALTAVVLRRAGLTTPAWGTWGRRHAVAAVGGLLLGALPLLLHNLPDAATLRFLAANAVNTELYGHNNLAVLANVRTQMGEWWALMAGDTIAFSARPGVPLGPVVAVVALVGLAVWLLRRWPRIHEEPGYGARLFLVLSVVTVVPLSAISTSHIGATYLLIIVPTTWLLVAVGLRHGERWLAARVPPLLATAMVWTVAGGLVAYQGLMQVRVLRSLERTGGTGAWSDAVTTLASELEGEFQGRPVVALDWGFSRNLVVLTQGRVQPRDVFELRPSPSPAFEDECRALFATPAHVYLRHLPPHEAFPGAWAVCARVASVEGVPLKRQRVLHTRTGEPVIEVYTVEPE